jgi:serine/threonine protein kinase
VKGVKVAIKVDSPALLKQTEKTRRMLEKQFVYEVETLYEYRHPNICALIAHCADGPTRSLVYELCEGGNLLDRIAAAKHPPLTWPQRAKIAVGIARGIGYLHSATPHPIVHRDVKVYPHCLFVVGFSLTAASFHSLFCHAFTFSPTSLLTKLVDLEYPSRRKQ